MSVILDELVSAFHLSPTVQTVIADVKVSANVLAGSFDKITDAFEKHDWGTLVDIGIEDAAKVIAAIDPAFAPLAGPLAAFIIYARHNPEGTLSPAMMKAAGVGGGQIFETGGVII